jgi:hypothetical protein
VKSWFQAFAFKRNHVRRYVPEVTDVPLRFFGNPVGGAARVDFP